MGMILMKTSHAVVSYQVEVNGYTFKGSNSSFLILPVQKYRRVVIV